MQATREGEASGQDRIGWTKHADDVTPEQH